MTAPTSIPPEDWNKHVRKLRKLIARLESVEYEIVTIFARLGDIQAGERTRRSIARDLSFDAVCALDLDNRQRDAAADDLIKRYEEACNVIEAASPDL